MLVRRAHGVTAAWQKHLSDASEEVAKTERLQAFTNAKASKPTSAKTGPSEAEYTAAAMQTEEVKRAKLREVAAIYAAILVKHTNYSNTQQVRALAYRQPLRRRHRPVALPFQTAL